jgi:hypothetical protein
MKLEQKHHQGLFLLYVLYKNETFYLWIVGHIQPKGLMIT